MLGKLQNFSPLSFLAAFLLIYALAALAFTPQLQILLHLTCALITAICGHLFFQRLSGRAKPLQNSLISALIIALILHYGSTPADLLFIVIAVLFDLVFRFFAQIKSTSLLNPAVFSLLLIVLVTEYFAASSHVFPSWWGVSFGGYFTLFLILIWLAFGLRKWHKWRIPLIFLASIFLYTLATDPQRLIIFTDATIWFLATIMLIDPKSSPPSPRHQWIFGFTVAIFYLIFLQLNLPYYELLAFLPASLLNLFFRRKAFLRPPST